MNANMHTIHMRSYVCEHFTVYSIYMNVYTHTLNADGGDYSCLGNTVKVRHILQHFNNIPASNHNNSPHTHTHTKP